MVTQAEKNGSRTGRHTRRPQSWRLADVGGPRTASAQRLWVGRRVSAINAASNRLRFATAVYGQRGPALLRPGTVDAMLHTPCPGQRRRQDPSISGLRWIVQRAGDGLAWSHAGALEGACTAWVIRRPDGTGIAFVFNSLPADYGTFLPAVGDALMHTTDTVGRRPSVDFCAGA